MDEKRKNNIVRYSGNKNVIRYHTKYIKINFVEDMANTINLLAKVKRQK